MWIQSTSATSSASSQYTLQFILLTSASDTESLVAAFRFLKKVSETKHLKEIIETQTVPPVTITEKEDLGGSVYSDP